MRIGNHIARKSRSRERGQSAIFALLLLTGMLLGFMALAIDVGRAYVVRGEIQTAAEAAALTAATRLIGTVNSSDNAAISGQQSLDTTTGRDNRFNLRSNNLSGSTDLATSLTYDYFLQAADARVAANGGQAGSDARYVRVTVEVETPAFFTRFLAPPNPQADEARPRVRAAATAGVGGPLCTVCGVDPIAVSALDIEDTSDFGFIPGEYYTLYLNLAQQRPNLAACPSQVPAALTGTLQAVQYSILNRLAAGPETDVDGLLFRLGGGGSSPVPLQEEIPACITVGTTEQVMPALQGTTCPTARLVARDLVCGWNTRFGIDTADNACANIAGIDDLRILYSADSDPGQPGDTPQAYASEYLGNGRRVLTAAIVDNSTDLTVLNFRQFFLENAPAINGLTVNDFRGAVRAQYVGVPVPVKMGSPGICGITRGVGKVVLHQ